MKKMLILGLTSIVGGVENYIMNFHEKLKNNYEIDFLLQFPLEGRFKRRLENENCKIHVVGNLKRKPLSTLKKLKRIYKDNNYDFIYVNLCNSSLFLYTIYAKKYNKNCKIVCHSHNGFDKHKFQHKLIRKLLLRNTDCFISCSDVAAKWMYGKTKNAIIIKNAIDSAKFEFNESDRFNIRSCLNISKDDFVIGHVGRFEFQKNHEFILELAKKLIGQRKIYFLLVGTGSKYEHIKYMADKQGLDHIIFTGIVDEPYKYYSSMDLFILPSHFEGFPIVGVEAQTNGLQCLFSDKITFSSSLSDRCKMLPLDIDVWVNTILAIYSNKDKDNNRLIGMEICKESGYDLKTEIKTINKIFEQL